MSRRLGIQEIRFGYALAEVVAPVADPDSKRYLKKVLLTAYLRDNVKAAELQPDGRYVRVEPRDQDRFETQLYFARPED